MIHTEDIIMPEVKLQYKNEKYDKWLIDLFIGQKRIKPAYNKIWNSPSGYQNIKEYIFNRYTDAINPIETIRRIQYNIEERPICPVCGKPVIFKGKPDSVGMYSKTCSPKCSTSMTNNWQYADREKMMQTKLEKYGNRGYCNPTKGVKTRKEKYGTANNHRKIEETKLKRYGDKNYRNVPKFHQTIQERYRMTWSEMVKSDLIQNATRQTLKEKYGVSSMKEYCNLPEHKEKFKKTICEKFNVDSISEYFKHPEIVNKHLQTIREKYGIEHAGDIFKLPEIQKKSIQSIIERFELNYRYDDNLTADENYIIVFGMMISTDGIQKKIHDTHKKNHSFSSSKGEQIILDLLKKSYSDIIYQYRSKEYPFNCDYYIPSLDLYIEYQGNQNHGHMPFDPNNLEHISRLEYWHQKNKELKERTNRKSTRYDKMIEGWTVSDPKKRSIALKNGLNLLEIWPTHTYNIIYKGDSILIGSMNMRLDDIPEPHLQIIKSLYGIDFN